MKNRFIVFILFIIIGVTPFFLTFNHLDYNESPELLVKNLEEDMPYLLRKYDTPGAAISIIENGELKWVGTFGYADIENELEIQKDTIFQMASISKPATALGIMELVENGMVNLDDPIGKYITRWEIPENTFNEDDVTIRRLLSHTAGLSRGGGYPGYEPSTELPTLEDSLSGIGGGSKPVEMIYEPQSKFLYSGGGYSLLQLLIEEVTRKDFSSYMDEEVLSPIGMKNSTFLWNEQMNERVAKGYNKDLEVLPNYLFIEKAAAGMYSTIEDMSEFLIVQLNSYENGDFLTRETMKEIYTPVIAVKGLDGLIYEGVGLGHFVNANKSNMKLISHDGSNKGWKVNFSIVPDTKKGLVILTNGDNGTYIINEVLNAWHFKIFNEKRSFDKLSHVMKSSVYSVSSMLILWSLLALLKLYKAVRAQRINTILTFRKTMIIFRILCSIFLIFSLFFLINNIVPLVAFINPNIGIVLSVALYIRTTVGVLELILVPTSR